MQIFKVSQNSDNNPFGEHFSAFVCAAESAAEARLMDPHSYDGKPFAEWGKKWNKWALSPNQVKVEVIGEAVAGMRRGVICSSWYSE